MVAPIANTCVENVVPIFAPIMIAYELVSGRMLLDTRVIASTVVAVLDWSKKAEIVPSIVPRIGVLLACRKSDSMVGPNKFTICFLSLKIVKINKNVYATSEIILSCSSIFFVLVRVYLRF